MQPLSSNHTALLDNDHRVPIYRVKVFDTPLTVPSKGFNVSFYELDDATIADLRSGATTFGSLTSDFTGLEYAPAALMFDWGHGSPPPLSQIDNYAIKWDGFFFARYSGQYTFYLDCGRFSGARIILDGTEVSVSDPQSNTDPWDADSFSESEFSGQTVSLTAGTWYPIEFHYWTGSNPDGASVSYVCFKYKEPGGATTQYDIFGRTSADREAIGKTSFPSDYESDNEKKVFSAGVVNTTQSFLTGSELTQVTELEVNRNKVESSVCKFSVPMTASTQLTASTQSTDTTLTVESTQAFPRDGAVVLNGTTVTYTGKTANQLTGCSNVPDGGQVGDTVALILTDYPFHQQTHAFGAIQKYRLYSIETGHYDPATETEYFIDRMYGHLVSNPTVRRSVDEDMLEVTIEDFQNMLALEYNRNYPDNASYSGAGYYKRYQSNEPDGQTRPVAYDKWRLDRAIRDIYIKSGIDPVLTYLRARMAVNDSPTFAGDFGHYRIQGSDVLLEHNLPYGNPGAIIGETPDAEYNWFFGYGISQLEQLSKLAQNYGFQLGFSGNGSARFEGVGIPTVRTLAKDATLTGAWSQGIDLGAYKGEYQSTATLNDSVQFTFDGRSFDLVLGRAHNTGLQIKVQVDGNDVASLTIDGEDVTGSNGVFDLDFVHPDGAGNTWYYYDGEYAVNAWNPSVLRYDGVLDFGQHTVTVTLISLGDAADVQINALFGYDHDYTVALEEFTTKEVMGGVDINYNYEDIRNYVTVVGVLQGAFQDQLGNVINPNNPITQHITSSASDYHSLYDNTALNYVGRRVSFEIYDPAIVDQGRADHIALNALKRHRNDEPTPRFAILTDPRYEPNDPISLHDIKLQTIDLDQVLWIESTRDRFTVNSEGKIDARTEYVVSALQPIPSYETRPEPDIQALFDGEPVVNIEIRQQGKRITGGDATADAAKTTITIGTDPGWETDMWEGYYFVKGTMKPAEATPVKILSNTSNTLTLEEPVDNTAQENWLITFDPFDSSLKGAPLEVHFDLLQNSRLEVNIVNYTSPAIKVATLNKSTKDDITQWSEGQILYWDGVNEYDDRRFYLTDDATRKLADEDIVGKHPYPFVAVQFRVTDPGDESVDIIQSYHDSSQDARFNGSDLQHSASLPGIVFTKVITPQFQLYPKFTFTIPKGTLEVAGTFSSKELPSSSFLRLTNDEASFPAPGSPDDYVGKFVRFGTNEIFHKINAVLDLDDDDTYETIVLSRTYFPPEGVAYADIDQWNFTNMYYEIWDLNTTVSYSPDNPQHYDNIQQAAVLFDFQLADIYSTDFDPDNITGNGNIGFQMDTFTIVLNDTNHSITKLERADLVSYDGQEDDAFDVFLFWWTPDIADTLFHTPMHEIDHNGATTFFEGLKYLTPHRNMYPVMMSEGYVDDEFYPERVMLPNAKPLSMEGTYQIDLTMFNVNGSKEKKFSISGKNIEGMHQTEWTNLDGYTIQLHLDKIVLDEETNINYTFWSFGGEDRLGSGISIGWLLIYHINVRDRANRPMAHVMGQFNDYLVAQIEPGEHNGSSVRYLSMWGDLIRDLLPHRSFIVFNEFERV